MASQLNQYKSSANRNLFFFLMLSGSYFVVGLKSFKSTKRAVKSVVVVVVRCQVSTFIAPLQNKFMDIQEDETRVFVFEKNVLRILDPLTDTNAIRR